MAAALEPLKKWTINQAQIWKIEKKKHNNTRNLSTRCTFHNVIQTNCTMFNGFTHKTQTRITTGFICQFTILLWTFTWTHTSIQRNISPFLPSETLMHQRPQTSRYCKIKGTFMFQDHYFKQVFQKRRRKFPKITKKAQRTDANDGRIK